MTRESPQIGRFVPLVYLSIDSISDAVSVYTLSEAVRRTAAVPPLLKQRGITTCEFADEQGGRRVLYEVAGMSVGHPRDDSWVRPVTRALAVVLLVKNETELLEIEHELRRRLERLPPTIVAASSSAWTEEALERARARWGAPWVTRTKVAEETDAVTLLQLATRLALSTRER